MTCPQLHSNWVMKPEIKHESFSKPHFWAVLEHQSHYPPRYSKSSKDGQHPTSAGSLSLTQLVTGEGSCGGCTIQKGWSEEVSVKWHLSKDLQVVMECTIGLYGEERELNAEGWSERKPLRLGVVSIRNCKIQRRWGQADGLEESFSKCGPGILGFPGRFREAKK